MGQAKSHPESMNEKSPSVFSQSLKRDHTIILYVNAVAWGILLFSMSDQFSDKTTPMLALLGIVFPGLFRIVYHLHQPKQRGTNSTIVMILNLALMAWATYITFLWVGSSIKPVFQDTETKLASMHRMSALAFYFEMFVWCSLIPRLLKKKKPAAPLEKL